MSSVTEINHPLAKSLVRTLRNRDTGIEAFRRALRGLGFFLAAEATATLPATPSPVMTPLDMEAPALEVDTTRVLLVPVLRAGLGFVESFLEFLPGAKVAHIGVSRDHESLMATCYVSTLPENRGEFDAVFVLDPMLATGNSSVKTLEILRDKGFQPEKITMACGFAVQEGIGHVQQKFPAVRIVTATVDWKLNDVGYIVPGLGDAGDRLYLL